jgi:hypothetical protein
MPNNKYPPEIRERAVRLVLHQRSRPLGKLIKLTRAYIARPPFDEPQLPRMSPLVLLLQAPCLPMRELSPGSRKTSMLLR